MNKPKPFPMRLLLAGAVLGVIGYFVFRTEPETAEQRLLGAQPWEDFSRRVPRTRVTVHEPRRADDAPAEATAELTLSLRGKVLTSSGAPVPAASLWYASSEGRFLTGELPTRTRTDSSGEFELPLPSVLTRLSLLCVADGFVAAVTPLTPQSFSRPSTPVTVTLETGHTVTGSVVDIWGSPISDAEVHVFGRFGQDLMLLSEITRAGAGAVGDYHRGRTDALGRFAVSGVGSLPVRLAATKTGYVYRTQPRQLQELAAAPVVLSPIGRLGLTFTDATSGEPIKVYGIKLTGQAGTTLSDFDPGTRISGEPPTGRDRGTGAQWYTLRIDSPAITPHDEMLVTCDVSAPGYQPLSLRSPVLFPDDPGYLTASNHEMYRRYAGLETGVLDVTARCPGLASLVKELTLIVVETAAAEPAQAAPVRVACAPCESHPDVLTGRAALPAGEYDVLLGTPRGWIGWRSHGHRQHATIPVNGSTSVEFQIVAGVARIRARDVHGEGLPTFHVDVYPRGGQFPILSVDAFDYSTAYSLDEARAILPASQAELPLTLRPGEYRIGVFKAGFKVAFEAVSVKAGEEVLIETVLEEYD